MNNRLLVPFLLLVLAGSLSRAVQGEAPSSTVVVDVPEYTVEKIGGWDYVDIPNGSALLVVGKPRVPFYSVFIEYPSGCRVQVVTMRERSGLITARDLNLSTVTRIPGSSSESLPSSDEDAGWYPEEDFSWQVFLNLDGSSTLVIDVFPFYYNSETKEARFYAHYEFDVAYVFSTVSIIDLATEKSVYDPGEEIVVNVLVNNSGEPKDVVASALIREYGSDEVVAGLPLRMLRDLVGEASFSVTWESTGFPTGDYSAEVVINDTAGNWLDRRVHSFRVGRMLVNVTGFSVDPKHFEIGQPVGIELEAMNVGSCSVSGRCVFLIQKAGMETVSFYHNFSSSAPGKSLKFASTWDTSSAEEGAVYYIIGYVSYESMTTPAMVAAASTNLFPIAKFSISQPKAGLGEDVTFDASGSSDPDGTIVDVRWDFGDGGESSGQTVTHSYHELGDYVVTLTVSDNEGASNETWQFIKVVMVYSLNVTSNIEVALDGSGKYREGDTVTLSAPPSVSIPGILGMLGAKYNFKQWSGVLNSTEGAVKLVLTGYDPRLDIRAIYVEDYSIVMVLTAIIAVVAVAVAAVSLRKRRRKK